MTGRKAIGVSLLVTVFLGLFIAGALATTFLKTLGFIVVLGVVSGMIIGGLHFLTDEETS